MQNEPVPPQNESAKPGSRLLLRPEHFGRIAKLSEIYLPSSSEAAEFSEDDLLANLYALVELSRMKKSGMKKNHAKEVERIVMSVDAAFIPANRQLPSSRHLVHGGPANLISKVNTRLLQQEPEQERLLALKHEIFGPSRIETEANALKLDHAQAEALKAKYREFVIAAVELLHENGVLQPRDYDGMVELWRQVSSLIWSNFAQAVRFDNDQHMLCTSLKRDILNCSTSTFLASDIFRQFEVESKEAYVAHAVPDSAHAILHCETQIGVSMYIETRAQYPDYYLMSLTFGIYNDMEKVSKEYPLVFIEEKFSDLAGSSHMSRAAVQSVSQKLETLQEMAKKDPENADNWFRLGQFFRWRQNDESAKAYFEKAIELNPSFTEAYFSLADAWINRNYYHDYQGKDKKADKQKAIDVLERGVEKNPKNAELWERLGSIYENEEKRIAAYTKAIEIKPAAMLYFSRASAYDQLSRHRWDETGVEISQPGQFVTNKNIRQDMTLFKKAAEDYRRAIELDPSMLEAYKGLSEKYRDIVYSGFHSGSSSKNESDLELKLNAIWKGAIQHNRNDPLFYEAYADTLMDILGFRWKEEEALRLYTHAIGLHQTSGLLQKRAGVLEAIKEYGKAHDDLKMAIELDPRNTYLYRKLAWLYERCSNCAIYSDELPSGVREIMKKEPERGLGDMVHNVLKEGVANNPKSHELNYHLGESYEYMGRGSSGSWAIEHYKKALDLLIEQKPEEDTAEYYRTLGNYHNAIARCYLDMHEYGKVTIHALMAKDAGQKYSKLYEKEQKKHW
ncbi:MAG: hypothetical protein NT051_03455 [Candidatus Micrarchaeota archaeon]|nr:hypothetical protein [Candidatus Micrarchaeota archaeon]